MAGGILLPHTISVQGNGNLGLKTYTDGGSGYGPQGVGVVASLGADSAAYCHFLLPQVLPAGVPKLQLWALANATSGTLKVTPYTSQLAAGSKPTQMAPTGFGYPEAQQTFTWANTGQQGVTAFTINAGGSGYAVGDIFQVSGGTSTQAALGYVTTVSSGAVTAAVPIQSGVYSSTPSSPAATTVVTGSGNAALTVTPTYSTAGDAGALKTATTGQIYGNQALVAGAPFLVALNFNTSGATLAAASVWFMGILWA